MFRKLIFNLVVAGAVACSGDAFGFALNGPLLGYESTALGYIGDNIDQNQLPQNIGDENRVTVPQLFFACDSSFLDYFGERGRQEVAKAVEYINDLPPFSSMSESLAEYPQATYRQNFQATSLQLLDLKSVLMYLLLLDIGLQNPEQYMWSVRDRVLPPGAECPAYDWILIVRNFDPVSWTPSSYVNGALYTYQWSISCPPAQDVTSPEPVLVDPTAFSFTSVAGGWFDFGRYYTGLTRDDIGGLRYIYDRQNYNTEALPANITAGTGGGVPWSIVDPNATNAPIADTTALRGGLDKFTIEERPYDSLLSQFFVGFTNNFTATIVTNGAAQSQSYGRPVLVPDIIFSADNLSVTVQGGYLAALHTTPGYSNDGAGPGTLNVGGGVPLQYTINKIGETFEATSPSFITEPRIQPLIRWGSFDGTTNAPFLYPQGSSIRDLEDLVLGQ